MTTTVIWNFPTRILFGEESMSEVPAEVKRLRGTRALIVSDPGIVGAGLAERLGEILREAQLASEVFSEVSSNPTGAQAEAAAAAFRDAKADIVIALGGGSPIDVGKLVRICATHPPPLAQYDDAKGGSEKITQPLVPMIAIPTTAGTGSEVGRSAVATLAETNRKTIFFAPNLIPDVAILDPSVTLGMPRKITAATGFDALTHNVEAYCTTMDHPMAEAIALEGIALCARHLERAVRNGADIAARGGMLKAATLGAVAFQKGLGACHSLAHPLSAELDMHHGLANALCLPAVIDFNRSVVAEKLARVARLFGAKGDDDETLAFECSGAIRALRASVGLPDGLEAAGVDPETVERLADLAFEDICHQENPRPCTRDDLLQLYKASL